MTRTCGTCQACCVIMAVGTHPGGRKGPYKACSDQCATGCAIYATKPEECSTFKCEWLGAPEELQHMIRDEERPDRCGVMFTLIGSGTNVENFRRQYGLFPLQAFEVWPGALKGYAAQKVINRLRRRFLIGMCPYGTEDWTVVGPDGYDRRTLDKLTASAREIARKDAILHGDRVAS
jgi:hypothetical protein